MRPRHLLLLIAMIATACSGDDTGSSGADPSNPSSTGSAVTSTTTTEEPPRGSGGFVALCPGFEVPEEPRAVVVGRPVTAGPVEDVIAQELEALTAGLTPGERADGLLVPWPEGADVLDEVTLDGAVLTVDFATETRDEYIAAPGTGRQFFIPVIETAFHHEEVEQVELLLGGSARAWNAWWQGEASSFDRADWRSENAVPEATCPPPITG